MLKSIPDHFMIKIIDAVRLDNNSKLAFVGSGGKTTAMFQLARQFEAPVIVTTTTHLAVEQGELADVHYALAENAPFPALEQAIQENQVILLTGEPHSDARLGSIPAQILAQLKSFVDEHGIPLLLEADGSRKLPIKAPAEKEPVIPEWVNAVCVVVGLSSAGRMVTAETVHRVEQFVKITGARMNEPLLFDHMEKMLLHPLGGLKGIPAGARRIVLLNQADSEAVIAKVKILADRLVGVYDSVLVAS